MVSHLLYSQLALLAIVWLFVMVHLPESKPSLPAPGRWRRLCPFVPTAMVTIAAGWG
jgi:hypothetical protein